MGTTCTVGHKTPGEALHKSYTKTQIIPQWSLFNIPSILVAQLQAAALLQSYENTRDDEVQTPRSFSKSTLFKIIGPELVEVMIL